MNSLAELKRYLQVGKKVKLVYAKMPNHRFLGLDREVVKVQTNGIYFNNPLEGAGSRKSWLEFPKANDLLFIHNADGKEKFALLENNEPSLTYELI